MTSYFAPVAPISVHQRLAEAGVLGDYYLLLAHQVLDRPAIHKAFYRSAESNGGHKRSYIIMDNSLIELGYPLPVADVVLAAEIVNANVIVLPDVLGDRIATLTKTTEAMMSLDKLRSSSPYARKVKTLGVAQGETFNDVFSCARDMIQLVGVDMVSIPRHVTAKIGSRIRIVEAVRKYGKPIHLLGFSDNLFDDFSTLGLPGVIGIDSAVPIWYGLQGFELPTEPPINANFGKRPSDYEQQTEITQYVIHNVRRVMRWANIAKTAHTGR